MDEYWLILIVKSMIMYYKYDIVYPFSTANASRGYVTNWWDTTDRCMKMYKIRHKRMIKDVYKDYDGLWYFRWLTSDWCNPLTLPPRNLPATQLQVAMGIPLDRMPQIRSFYGASVLGKGRQTLNCPAAKPFFINIPMAKTFFSKSEDPFCHLPWK